MQKQERTLEKRDDLGEDGRRNRTTPFGIHENRTRGIHRMTEIFPSLVLVLLLLLLLLSLSIP